MGRYLLPQEVETYNNNGWPLPPNNYIGDDYGVGAPPFAAPEGRQWVQNGDQWELQGMPSKDWAGEKLLKTGLETTAIAGMGAGALGMLGAGGAIGPGVFGAGAAGDYAGVAGSGTDALSGGGGMDFMDLGGGISLDEFGNVGGGLFQGGEAAGGFDLGSGLSIDEFGNTTGGLFEGGPGTPGAGDFYNPMGGDYASFLKNLPAGLGRLLGGAGGLAKAGGIGGLLGGNGLNTAARMAPGMLALAYANQQPGIDTSGLEGILGKVGGNQNAIIQAATDPLQMNIARGYGDLLQSQGLRGIRGSSFGASDIGNYISSTGRTLANAGASAAEGSLALQGDLSTKIAALKNQAQMQKNNIFGKAFDVLGRGMGGNSGGISLNLG